MSIAKEVRVRVNRFIRVPEVRLVDAQGGQVGVVATRDALRRAEDAGLDLVEVSPNAVPPVCRIMDFGKYKYEIAKKQKSTKQSQTSIRVKEIKFHANTGEHDYETKVRHIRGFIEDGHKVKVSLFFRGRENIHKELGFDVMNKVMQDCADIANVEQTPKLLGKMVALLLAPKPKRS